MRISRPAIGYLVTSSKAGLESFELMRLSRVANLRKELRDVVKDWVESEVEARIARFILEERRAQDADRAAVGSQNVRQRTKGFLPVPGLLPAPDIEADIEMREELVASSAWRVARPLLPPAVPSPPPGVQMNLFAEPLTEKQLPHLRPLLAGLPAANAIRLKLPRSPGRRVLLRQSEVAMDNRAISAAQAGRSLALAALEQKPPETGQPQSFAPLLPASQRHTRIASRVLPDKRIRRARFATASSCVPGPRRAIPAMFHAATVGAPPIVAVSLASASGRARRTRLEALGDGSAASASPAQMPEVSNRVAGSIFLPNPSWLAGCSALFVPRPAEAPSEDLVRFLCSWTKVIAHEPMNVTTSRLAFCSTSCEIAVPRVDDAPIFIVPPARIRIIATSSRARSRNCARLHAVNPGFHFAVA